MSQNPVKVVTSKLSFKGQPAGKLATLKARPQGEKRKVSRITSSDDEKTEANNEDEIKVIQGTGRITSSSTTVHGQYTVFMDELSVGDAIIITHPTTYLEETKIVKIILSNVSMSVSSAFSSDLITTTPFRYIKVPKDLEKVAEDEKVEKQQRQRKEEESAYGTYASNGGENFVYRVKKEGAFGGYKIATETISEKVSREDLLDRRTKKKSDRCEFDLSILSVYNCLMSHASIFRYCY